MGRAQRLVIASLLLSAVAVGCATTSATSGSRPGPSPPAPSRRATARDQHGSRDVRAGQRHRPQVRPAVRYLHQRALGYRLLYPGGWNVTRKGTTVRIAKFGNAIVIAERPAKSAPKLKGVKAALKKQKAKGGLLAVAVPARPVSLSAGHAVRVVFTQARDASATSPAATLLVYRYILYHDGKVVVLSMLGPQEFDNRVAYKLIAETFAWS